MRKGIHPALQIMKIVTPDGRLWEVLTPRIYRKEMANRCRSLAEEEEAKQREGQIARFYRRYGHHDMDDDDAKVPSKRSWRDKGKDDASEDED